MVVGLVCEVPPMFGGERVPAEVEAQVASLTMPASKKYGGNLPYAAELMALAGLGLLVRYAFWPPGAPDKVERLQAQQEQLRAQQAEEREAEERAASKWDAPE